MIVNVSSSGSLMATPGVVPYASAKAALARAEAHKPPPAFVYRNPRNVPGAAKPAEHRHLVPAE